jgi:hypothetical protein
MPGDRRAAAAADVRRRARNGTRGGDAAEQRRHDVRSALRDQLHVGPVRPPIMPSATTADSSDSTAASSAMVNAGPISAVASSKPIAWQPTVTGSDALIATEPAADRLDIAGLRSWTAAVVDDQCDERRGNPSTDLRPQRDDERAPVIATATAAGLIVSMAAAYATHFSKKSGRHIAHAQAEEVLQLAREDHDCNAAGEARHDRVWNELDGAAQPRQTEQREDHASHHRRHEQPINAVLLHDAVNDDDECARRPADLHARAAQRRDQESGYDGGVQATVGRDAARNGECNGERQRDNADNDAGADVGRELRARVVFKGGGQLRDEHNASDAIMAVLIMSGLAVSAVGPGGGRNPGSSGRRSNGRRRRTRAPVGKYAGCGVCSQGATICLANLTDQEWCSSRNLRRAAPELTGVSRSGQLRASRTSWLSTGGALR